MRAALFTLAACAALGSTAMAQTSDFRVAPNAILRAQQSHMLDGAWSVGGLGPLALTTRDAGVLEGELEGRPCHGQYQGNAFTLLCQADGRGPVVLVGWAYEAPPVAATARARVAAQPAEMRGQIYQASLSGRARLDEVAELRAARQ